MPNALAREASAEPIRPRTQDTQRLAQQLGALEFFLGPVLLPHGGVGFHDIARHGDHHRKGQFGHSHRGGLGGVEDLDPLALAVGDIHVVQTHAAANDQLEVRGLVDIFLGDFRLAANQDHFGIGQTILIVGDVAVLGQFARQDVIESVRNQD